MCVCMFVCDHAAEFEVLKNPPPAPSVCIKYAWKTEGVRQGGLEMKENGEAGEEDEASAQLAVFLSAQTLTATVVFSLSAADVSVVACQCVFHLGGERRGGFRPLQECS